MPINIAGINELENITNEINENGKEPLENARIKAWHYYKQIKKPVFSSDSGLFFEKIETKDRPGTYIRRINGKMLNDDEMIEYYTKLAKKYGGEITGYYKNAICIIINENKIIECDNEKISSEHFIITSKPHKKREEGFPLDSISKEIKSKKYYYDINRIMDNKDTEEEYIRIFTEIIGHIK
jgi:8-oxo-dGTP diphosphatase